MHVGLIRATPWCDSWPAPRLLMCIPCSACRQPGARMFPAASCAPAAVYAANLGREYVMPVIDISQRGGGYKSDIKALCELIGLN